LERSVQYRLLLERKVQRIARSKAFDRQKALSQALWLFWRKGYAATSIEDLTETLHLSRSSLYDTFGDKRTLFLEALKYYSERVISGIEQTLTKSPSPITGIQAIFEDLIDGIGQESGSLGCFMVNSVTELVPYDPNVTKLATEYADSIQQLLQAVLKEASTQNLVTEKQTSEQLAAYVYNTIQGMRVLIKAGATREQMQAISDITLKSLQT
jgi:TetR/AcrR family transcriptional regulator, transcriptional repressor for nem operon